MPDFELNFNEGDYNIIAETGSQNFGTGGDYIRVSVLDQNSNIITLNNGKPAIFYSGSVDTPITIPGTVSTYTTIVPNQFDSYYSGNELYIKPNEILASSAVPTSNYKLQVDFLNQYQPSTDGGEDTFVVKQISPSRLEVRLKLFSTNISTQMESFVSHLGDPYEFNHILYIGGGKNLPIVNYTFDKFTDGETNQSIILKLYEPLPSSVRKLDVVTVEREVLITQIQDVRYESSITGQPGLGSLTIDQSDTWTNQQGGDDALWQNYTDLVTSSSADSTTINSLITGSSYDYPNLNIDYNSFENHTFFGSAVKKLENFKTKVSTIEDYYSDISSSLSAASCSISGDPTFVKTNREYLFNKIQDEINSFTSYERFLYFDGQSQTTSSAPSLGDNYADTIPVNKEDLTTLTNYDGFNTVYKHTNEGSDDQWMRLFTEKYHAQNKPFFNYSSSIYLSFILKGDETVGNADNGTLGLSWDANTSQEASDNELEVPLPRKALYINKQEDPSITGSEYRRFIYHTSQSYWIPNEGIDFNDLTITSDLVDASEVTILSGSIKTGSYQIQDSTGKYPTTVVTQSGAPFYGACMPAGELFRVYWQNSLTSPITSSYITDIKVTLNDPTDTLPFSYMYKTGSATFDDWYTTLQSQASTFDDENIHSLNNNIPTYIQESSEYDDLKTFLNMNGEHYDLIRNHIDNYTSIYNRGYNELDSVPKNLMPILADSLGWELITPFTGSLAQIFNSSVSSTTTQGDIRHNTWRKSLNNLIYLYKSKGTKNAVRALLNIYGYPPDVINISEFGGSSEDQVTDIIGNGVLPLPSNPQPLITNDFDTIKDGLNRVRGNVSFVSKPKKLYNYMFNSNSSRILGMDWWLNNANVETVEFVYKHKASTTDQEILKSSGSGTQTLWDLRVQESASLYNFEFRLNNSRTGSSAIASNAVSMSTSYSSIGEGSLWNVMLQRMSSSISGSGTQGYKLAAAFQDKDKITILNATSMSVNGGLTRDANYNANENWQSSGSRHYLSSSNLIVGRSLSGSLAEFRTWTSTLSASVFKQHVFNKQSVVGNSITSHKDDLIQHYRLNENWKSGSLNPKIKDANPKGPKINPTNYDIALSTNLITSSLYGYDEIDTYSLTLRTDSYNQPEDNKIIIKPKKTLTGRTLNPHTPSVFALSSERSTAPRKNSPKLEITNSPTNFINDFIVNNLSNANILKSYIKPSDRYESTYADLDTFRDNFFGNYDITINTNKFIRAHENIWNQSIISAIKKVVPARSTLSDSSVGVTIQSHLLEHQKVEKKKPTLQYGETGLFSPDLTGKAADLSDIIDMGSRIDILETYEATKDTTIDINEKTSLSDSSYENSKDSEINIDTLITETATYENSKDSEININSLISETLTYQASRDSEININSLISETLTYEASKETEIDIDTTVTEEMSYESSKDTEINGLFTITETMENGVSKNAEIDIDNVITETLTHEASNDSEIDIDTLGTKEMSYEPSTDTEIDGLLNITETMENGVTKAADIDGLLNITETMENGVTKDAEINGLLNITETMENGVTKDAEINGLVTPIGEHILSIDSNIIDYHSTHWIESFRTLHKEWGTGDTDTHFLNMAARTDSGSLGDYNVNHIDDRFVFRMVGDVEVMSSSLVFSTRHIDPEKNIDFNNPNTFLNREIRDKGKGYTYKSYIGNNDGPQDGRPVGKTSYYSSSHDGSRLFYPSNHWSKFDRPFTDRMYEGTQTTDIGHLNVKDYEDYSTASFYSVEVAFEHGIKVRRGDSKGSEDIK